MDNMSDNSLIDALAEALRNSDEQLSEEIQQELRDEGVDVDGGVRYMKRKFKDFKIKIENLKEESKKNIVKSKIDEIEDLKKEFKRNTVKLKVDECERCQKCERLFSTVWYAPDEVWERVVGGNGSLCPGCSTKLAEGKGIPLYWECAVSDFPTIKAVK